MLHQPCASLAGFGFGVQFSSTGMLCATTTNQPILKIVLKKCLLLIGLIATISSCNDPKNRTTIKKILPDYNFSIPKGWQAERITFPIDFAPGIPYRGVEDLRFTPGWEFATSEEHWSYIFLWWVDGIPDINDSILQNNLNIYYTGLVSRNIAKRNIPANKIIPTITIIRKIETTQNETNTYKGTITITDYLDFMYNAITLNCLIHEKSCGKHTAIIFEISPKPFENNIWQTLNKINESFSCGN